MFQKIARLDAIQKRTRIQNLLLDSILFTWAGLARGAGDRSGQVWPHGEQLLAQSRLAGPRRGRDDDQQWVGIRSSHWL
jgi:hypothetical protein